MQNEPENTAAKRDELLGSTRVPPPCDREQAAESKDHQHSTPSFWAQATPTKPVRTRKRRPAEPARHKPPVRGPPRRAVFDYELLTFDDVAARLHCARQTVKQRYRLWGLRPVRIAGRCLIPSNQLAALERRLIEEGIEI
jgi:hypothetical protein